MCAVLIVIFVFIQDSASTCSGDHAFFGKLAICTVDFDGLRRGKAIVDQLFLHSLAGMLALFSCGALLMVSSSHIDVELCRALVPFVGASATSVERVPSNTSGTPFSACANASWINRKLHGDNHIPPSCTNTTTTTTKHDKRRGETEG